ncbi:MAG: hypothetical protein ACYTKD_16465 [Planctomycetota bacterium]|jgi:hypothetical protein
MVNLECGVAREDWVNWRRRTRARLGADWYVGRFFGVGGEIARTVDDDFFSLDAATWRARIKLSAGSRLSLECYVGGSPPSGLGSDDDDIVGASCTLRL